MTVQDHLRELLEANKDVFFSGEEIARQLGVSRNAVWKAIKSLQSDGYPIDAVPNKGYCLNSTSDVLSESGIRQYLRGEARSLALNVYDSVSSTNIVLRELANSGSPEGTVVVAATQTGGRGRKGRSFFSPERTGVYVSILLKPDIAAEDATFITTTAAVAVCDAVGAVSDRIPEIKWVNDVFIDGKKICGILTEASLSMESGRIEYAVLGTGINVYTPEGGFPQEIRSIATSVFDRPQPDAKNRLIAEYLNSFMPRFRDLGGSDTIAEYRRCSFVVGRTITVISGAVETRATALGVDDRCRLLVEYGDGTRAALSSGEISIRI